MAGAMRRCTLLQNVNFSGAYCEAVCVCVSHCVSVSVVDSMTLLFLVALSCVCGDACAQTTRLATRVP